jgi:hypothetical protein
MTLLVVLTYRKTSVYTQEHNKLHTVIPASIWNQNSCQRGPRLGKIQETLKHDCSVIYVLTYKLHLGFSVNFRMVVSLVLSLINEIQDGTLFTKSKTHHCRSQWPRGLRHELSSLARTLASWARIPFEAWMSVLCAFILCLCCSVCR